MQLAPLRLSKKSTIVQLSDKINQRGLFLAIKTLGNLMPDAGASWAEQLFRKPRRHPAPPEEAQFLSKGLQTWIRVDGKRVSTWTFGQGPWVYLLHGWEGRAGQFRSFVEPLVEAGYRVCLIDAIGHGESEGTLSSLVEFARCLSAAVEHFGPAHAVIGHSMGGPASALAMSRGTTVEKAIFIGSPAEPEKFFNDFVKLLRLPPGISQRMRQKIEEDLEMKWEELPVSYLAPRITGTQLLLIHDVNDKEVPVSATELYEAHWPGARIEKTQGLGHRRILRSDEVIRKTVAFIRESR